MMRRLHLTRLRWEQTEPPSATEYFPGDVCPTEGCKCTITVYSTKHTETQTMRYMRCDRCGFLPENKLVEARKSEGRRLEVEGRKNPLP